MGFKFTKMHGLGNDYVFVSLFDQQIYDPVAVARRVSDRHTGIGSDGLILVATPTETDAHIRMIIYNADGSRAQMCGNGLRCVARLAYERGLSRANPLHVQTDNGVLTAELILGDGGRVAQVRVDMGEPVLDAKRIPVAMNAERIVAHTLPLEGHTLSMTCVSMGNPHAVFFESDLARVPLKTWGPQLETHPLFPERANIHFVQVASRQLVGMITWERGSGITRACGTGAAAACVAGVLNELTERTITAQLPGGRLRVEWDEENNHVFQTGPAAEVFVGEWPGE